MSMPTKKVFANNKVFAIEKVFADKKVFVNKSVFSNKKAFANINLITNDSWVSMWRSWLAQPCIGSCCNTSAVRIEKIKVAWVPMSPHSKMDTRENVQGSQVGQCNVDHITHTVSIAL